MPGVRPLDEWPRYDQLHDYEDLGENHLDPQAEIHLENSFSVARRAAHCCSFDYSSCHHYRCPAGNPFDPANRTEAFCSSSRHSDRSSARRTQIALHFLSHRCNLWALAHDRC